MKSTRGTFFFKGFYTILKKTQNKKGIHQHVSQKSIQESQCPTAMEADACVIAQCAACVRIMEVTLGYNQTCSARSKTLNLSKL